MISDIAFAWCMILYQTIEKVTNDNTDDILKLKKFLKLFVCFDM